MNDFYPLIEPFEFPLASFRWASAYVEQVGNPLGQRRLLAWRTWRRN